MKKIILLATGGTIASSGSEHGLKPTVDVEQLLSFIPEVRGLCQLERIALMQIDSTNMNPERMAVIAKAIEQHCEEADGFVVAHGTDTMAYSAAALTFMLQNLGKPVVFTGSQLPIEASGTDGKKNLSDAIHFACEDISGVYLVFDGKVIDGTHGVKMKTRSMDAFYSVNAPEAAHIVNGRIVHNPAYMQMICGKRIDENSEGCEENCLKKSFKEYACSGNESEYDKDKTIDKNSEVCQESHLKVPFMEYTCSENLKETDTWKQKSCMYADTAMCQDVIVLKLFPGMPEQIFDYIRENYRGVIIEGFGIGGIPGEQPDLAAKVKELAEAGLAVVITTQCMYEGVDLSVYEVGQNMDSSNIILGGTMTTEALTMKLMWALAHFEDLEKVKEFME